MANASSKASSRLLSMLALLAAGSVFGLAGCDDQGDRLDVGKLRDFFNSIKPDALLLRGLEPGVTGEAQVRDQMGKPETERRFADGSKRLEYPRGPQGVTTYMVDIDPSGTLRAVTQVLTAENFAAIRIGMTEDEVRSRLGKPGQVAVFPLKPETVWSWKWQEGAPVGEAFFNVHFDQSGHVYTTSRSDIIRGR